MDVESEFFDASDNPELFDNLKDNFDNLNVNNFKDISEYDDVKVKSALNPEDYFLSQFPADHESGRSPTDELDQDRSSPLLLDDDIEPIKDEDDEVINKIGNLEEKWVIDDAYITKSQATLTDEEKQTQRAEAKELKAKGNVAFKDGEYSQAESLYTDALKKCLIADKEDRAILFSNRAACRIQQNFNDLAIEDCTKAIELNPTFIRALLRRADTYEKTEKLDEALADYQKLLELEPTLHQARSACLRLPEQIRIRNEKMKDEMIGKLKDLGNLVLRPFGLSTDNFKVQQDPTTGSYSINFQQNSNK